MTKFTSPVFRQDIQGLRAVAVLLVIFAHLGFPWVSGGFVGVDVFFVISGFLITGLLLREYETTGRLLLVTFYLRRLRRLLPALLVVLGFTSVMVYWQLFESDSSLILASLPYAATWTSNLFFVLGESNYFNELADKDIFLHTWSLGVEEQFYLLWPVLLLAFIATAKTLSLLRSLLLLVVSSFVLSVVWSYWDPISAFYMMPARIWQFGLGGLVYLYTVELWAGNRVISDHGPRVLLALGLMLILLSAFLLDEQALYPGFWALFPSLGAACVILAGSAKQIQKTASTDLAHPLFVWLGDRSYSLYLWHWPVIVFVGFWEEQMEIDYSDTWLALLLTLVLAMITYRWIELPFWKRSLKLIPTKTFLLGAGASVLLILAIAFHIQRLPSIVETQINQIPTIRIDMPVIYKMPCDSWYHSSKVEPCTFGPADAPNTAVMLGDSIGAQWFSSFAEIYLSQQWRFVMLTKSACPMVDEDVFYHRIGKIYDICRQWRDTMLTQINSFSPKVIIMGNSANYAFTPDQWVEGSQRILEKLSTSAENVVIISGAPALGFDGPSCIGRKLQLNNKLEANDCVSKGSVEKYVQVAGLLSKAAAGFPNVQVINPVDLVCPEGQCRALLPTGVHVYRDSSHLTDTFVRSTVGYFRKHFPHVEIAE